VIHSTSEQKAQAWDMAWQLLLDACTLPKNPRKAYLVARDPVRVHMLCNVVPSLRRRAAIIRRNAKVQA